MEDEKICPLISTPEKTAQCRDDCALFVDDACSLAKEKEILSPYGKVVD